MRHTASSDLFAPALRQPAPRIIHVHQLGGGTKLLAQQRSSVQHGRACRDRKIRSTTSALEEADWEEEMSLFRKRLQKPNQLETMRKIVEEVDIGKVSLSHKPCPQHTDSSSAGPFAGMG